MSSAEDVPEVSSEGTINVNDMLDKSLEEILLALTIKTKDDEETFPTFLRAFTGYEQRKMYFPLKVSSLHILKEKYISKRRTTDKKPSYASKKQYCRQLDKYMKELTIARNVTKEVTTTTLGNRWSKTRDGFRLALAIHANQESFLRSYASQSREQIEEKDADSDKVQFYKNVMAIYNNDDWTPRKAPEVYDGGNENDKVNIAILQEIVDDVDKMKRKVNLTYKMCVTHTKTLEDIFIRTRMNINKSGTHTQDPAGKYFRSTFARSFVRLLTTFVTARTQHSSNPTWI